MTNESYISSGCWYYNNYRVDIFHGLSKVRLVIVGKDARGVYGVERKVLHGNSLPKLQKQAYRWIDRQSP